MTLCVKVCLLMLYSVRHMQRKDPENRLFVWADGLGTHKTEE